MPTLKEHDILKKKISLRNWLLERLKKFETRYSMSTKKFLEKWRSGKISEPESNEQLEDFLEWEGLANSLAEVEEELIEIEKRIRKS